MVDITRENRRPRGEGKPPRIRQTVCVKTPSGIVRIKKTEAARLVAQGKGTYCPRREWKQQRDGN